MPNSPDSLRRENGSGAAAAAKSLQSCPTLCNAIDSSPPGSPIPGILQARILEWLPFPSPMGVVGCKKGIETSRTYSKKEEREKKLPLESSRVSYATINTILCSSIFPMDYQP